MKSEKEPKMLIVEELIDDLTNNLNEIEKYIKCTDAENHKCNFIYVYSLFEGALWQLAKSVLFAFNEKLTENNAKLQLGEGRDLSFDGGEMIDSFIEEKLREVCSGNLARFIGDIMQIIGVRVNYEKEIFYLISKTRNQIVHTNTAKHYNEYNRASLPYHTTYDEAEIKLYMKELREFLNDTILSVSAVYKDYTYKKLLKESWEYTVGGYLKFDDIVKFEKSSFGGNRTTVGLDIKNVERASKGFSSSEKTTLAFWLHQYSDTINDQYLKFHDVRPIVSISSPHKLIYLIKLFERFPFLMNGHDFGESK